MNIQYCHVRKYIPDLNAYNSKYECVLSATGGETVAMQELEPWFVESLKPGDFFTKLVGKARCSDKENYNKKVGRELAKSRMSPTILTVLSNSDYGNTRVLILVDSKKNMYELHKKATNAKVHFLGYE